jgi:hypothetical protein
MPSEVTVQIEAAPSAADRISMSKVLDSMHLFQTIRLFFVDRNLFHFFLSKLRTIGFLVESNSG